MKKRITAWLIMLVITVAAGFCLSLTNEVTKGTIASQEEQKAETARTNLLPQADTFEKVELAQDSGQTSLYMGKKADETVGYVAVVTAKGFGGAVEVTVGVEMQGNITGITVGGASFSETAGLGAKSKDKEFTSQFNDRAVPLKVIKAGGTKADNTIDAITAATITSTAVTGAVNEAGNYVKELLGLNKEEETTGKTAKASAKGFGGPVAVTLTLDDNGAISEIVIGDENFAETEGFGAKALEPEFAAQFIGMTPPLELSGIDAISGATYTSEGVVNAINKAYEKIQEAASVRSTKASAKGFGGPVAVTITLDDSNAISEIVIGDDNFAETEGFGAKALEPEFAAQFIGKKPPLQLSDIDAISGATYTSEGVVNAINKAYDKLMNSTEASASTAEPTVAPTVVPETTGGDTFTASKPGFGGPVSVTLTVGENNTIAALTIGDASFAETAGLGAKALEPEFAAQFVGKSLPVALTDIDAISGATITSQAVVDAVNKAYGKYQAENTAEPTAAPTIVPETTGGDTFTASKPGFGGPVSVTLTVGENNTIAALTIGDASFAETAGLGAKALEPEFAAQFVGKSLPVALTDIDAISGATITSQAVVDAVNKAYTKYQAANGK